MSPASPQGVTRAPNRVQARPVQAWLALALLLGGCANGPSIDPVDWWHQLEGGPIADARPPPPNADAPYPKVTSVPAKPAPPSAATLQGTEARLLADRRSAQFAARIEPIPQLPQAAAHAAPQPAPAATGDEEAPNASLVAANAPPPKPAPPAPAAAPVPSAAPAATAGAAAAGAAMMPEMPAAPPPAPRLAGVDVPAVSAPTPPPVPPPPPRGPPPPPGPPVAIPFERGSALLTVAARAQIKTLAAQHGARHIAIIGFGEAAGGAPAQAQAAALPLALDRARAVAAQLVALGVSAGIVRIAALPAGGGAVARLVD